MVHVPDVDRAARPARAEPQERSALIDVGARLQDRERDLIADQVPVERDRVPPEHLVRAILVAVRNHPESRRHNVLVRLTDQRAVELSSHLPLLGEGSWDYRVAVIVAVVGVVESNRAAELIVGLAGNVERGLAGVIGSVERDRWRRRARTPGPNPSDASRPTAGRFVAREPAHDVVIGGHHVIDIAGRVEKDQFAPDDNRRNAALRRHGEVDQITREDVRSEAVRKPQVGVIRRGWSLQADRAEDAILNIGWDIDLYAGIRAILKYAITERRLGERDGRGDLVVELYRVITGIGHSEARRCAAVEGAIIEYDLRAVVEAADVDKKVSLVVGGGDPKEAIVEGQRQHAAGCRAVAIEREAGEVDIGD